MESLIMDPLLKAGLVIAAGATVLYAIGLSFGLYLHRKEVQESFRKKMPNDTHHV